MEFKDLLRTSPKFTDFSRLCESCIICDSLRHYSSQKKKCVGKKKFVRSLCLRKKKFCRQVGLTSVYDSYNLLLKLDKLGFQLSKQGRQELPGLKLQSMIVILDKL